MDLKEIAVLALTILAFSLVATIFVVAVVKALWTGRRK